MEGPECWAKELELSVIGNGEPLENCEQERDMVRFASEYVVWKLVWGNGLVRVKVSYFRLFGKHGRGIGEQL